MQAEVIAARLVRVLGQVAADPGIAVTRVEILDAAERRVLLAEWNDSRGAGAGGNGGGVVRGAGGPGAGCGGGGVRG